MHATDAASLLERLARGGEVDLSSAESAWIEQLIAAGLALEAPDTSAERARLTALKDELAGIARSRTTAPADASLVARERALRTEVLDLSERVARGDGAARVSIASSAGPYRGSQTEQRNISLTQRGRALVSNLGPRASRASGLTLDQFETHMEALKKLFAWRSGRAMTIVDKIGGRAWPIEQSAIRTVAIGLSGRRESEELLAEAFVVLYGAIRSRQPSIEGLRFTAAQDASATECLLLTAADPQAVAYDARSGEWFVDLRMRLLGSYCQGRPDDALDAALLLAAIPTEQHEGRIASCVALATELGRQSVPIPLSLALLLDANSPIADLVLSYRALAAETYEPLEALAAAVLVTRAGGAIDGQLERVRRTRDYLARFAPTGMTLAAAMLTLLESDTPALLDDLRLASAEVQRYQLATGGAEAMMHAIKLLVQSSLLAHGAEGDPEEGIALVARALPGAGALGLGAAAATLPMVVSAISTFHRPMLDAALVYETAYQPTHSDYVFGSGYGSGSRTHHRTIGWG
jgi:hypothetical protein